MVRAVNQRVAGYYPKNLYEFVCEDEKSMCFYLAGFAKVCKEDICIKIQHSYSGTTVSDVVDCGLIELDKLRTNADNYGKNSKIILCFDKDSNNIEIIKEKIKKIQQLSKKHNDVTFIYNNPCYEYWLLLHTQRIKREFCSSEECVRYCMQKINQKYHTRFQNISDFKKYKRIFECVGPDIHTAIQNAKALNFCDDDLDRTYTNTHLVFEEMIKMPK